MNVLRNIKYVLTKAKGAPPDAEQGYGQQQAPSLPAVSDLTGEKRESTMSLPSEPIDPSDKLANFRLMCGITTHPALERSPRNNPNRAPNLGIYMRVIRNEQNAAQSYRFASILINGCLGLQIIVAAALTAMGAGNVSHSAITVFGAINTVIAGILTYLKGSGLPNRLKYYKTEWRRIREFIEQKERDLTRPNCQLDIYEVIDAIEVMYEETKADIESNIPDGYHSQTKQRTATIQGPVPAGQNLSSMRKPSLGDRLDEYQNKYGDRVSSFASRMSERVTDAHKGVESRVGEVRQHGQDAQHEIEKARREVEEFARHRMSQFSDVFSEKPHVGVTFSHGASGAGLSAGAGSSAAPAQPPPTHQP